MLCISLTYFQIKIESTLVKETHNFEIKFHLWGHIKKTDAVNKIKKFVDDAPDKNNIKIITFALMGHGRNMKQEIAEGDWSVL